MNETMIEPVSTMPTKPGVYRGLPAADYHRLPFASAHRLGDLAQSPAHMRDRMLNPTDPTPAMVLGTAVHDLVLEEVDRVTVSEQCSMTTAKGSRCSSMGKYLHHSQWFCGTHCKEAGDEVGRAVLTPDQYHVVQCAAAAVQRHPAARDLLDARTDTELTVIWDDPATGVRCKLRADGVIYLPDSPGICWDLKTIADDASPKSFTKEIFSRDYEVNAAFYINGLCAAGLSTELYSFIAVEKVRPFGVGVYELSDSNYAINPIMDAARDHIARMLELWAKCEKSGIWPCYSEKVQRVIAPRFAAYKWEME